MAGWILSVMKKKILLAVMVIAIIYCSCNTQDTSAGTINTHHKSKEESQPGPVSEEEPALRTDSVVNPRKQRMWVYQIGGPISKEEQAAAKFEKLKTIAHLYIFKRSPHEYYIIKDDTYKSNQQLIDSFSGTRIKLEAISNDRLDIVDLSLLCPPKENPTLSKPVIYKNKSELKEIECRSCE